MSEKSRQLFRKGSERMMSLRPMVSDFVQKEKERLDKFEEVANDKYSSIKGKSKGFFFLFLFSRMGKVIWQERIEEWAVWKEGVDSRPIPWRLVFSNKKFLNIISIRFAASCEVLLVYSTYLQDPNWPGLHFNTTICILTSNFDAVVLEEILNLHFQSQCGKFDDFGGRMKSRENIAYLNHMIPQNLVRQSRGLPIIENHFNNWKHAW